MRASKRILSYFCVFAIVVALFPGQSVAQANWEAANLYGKQTISKWLNGIYDTVTIGGWNPVTYLDKLFSSNKPQNYYTTPTNSVQDKDGNVTNYYRGGDTTNTQIIDSYNKTFNTIHNTTNNTNNYQANVKLENFLNQYTTNNNNYTYSTQFKSWYYDNTTNNYDYTQNNLYYNQDNSQYYISIDNSTDEYYLIDVQYSPTFVTVNYIYNNIDNSEHVGDVTNVYYFELKDGRNSSTLTTVEVSGLDIDYNAANYDLVMDDPNTLSLQHFDGDYTDSSSFNRSFYSQNRSNIYVDSGAFGQAVKLSSGSAAGVQIPDLSGYNSLSFDFRVYYADISHLGIYFGDTNIFQRIPSYKSQTVTDYYSDDGNSFNLGRYCEYYQSYYGCPGGQPPSTSNSVDLTQYGYSYSNALKSSGGVPSANGSGWTTTNSSKYGWYSWPDSVTLYSSNTTRCGSAPLKQNGSTERVTGHIHGFYDYISTIQNRKSSTYRVTPVSVPADFSYSNYKNQWVSMRVTISGGYIYYFVNGDLVGAGSFSKPAADKFYIKSSGTVYLDELRVTTGSLSSTSVYTPSSSPYDTNKVLALPDNLTANTIYVQNNIEVTNLRVGGVRPSNPPVGFFYVPLYDDRTAAQPLLYDGSNWINVNAMVHNGDTTVNILGYKFSPVGDSPDVDINLKPEHPTKPGDDVDPETCTHKWEVTGGEKPTCALPGTVESTCSLCKKTKTETLPKLAHTWEVKQSVQTSYDENGNVVTQGFTIYRCSLCGEEYKDADGSGPPSSSPSAPGGDGEEDEGFLGWLMRKIGEVLGAIGGGILDLLKAALGKILDGLIDLITMAFDKLTQLVDLFGSFGDALGVLWTWLPPEVILVLVAGVTVFVFIGLLKVFMK